MNLALSVLSGLMLIFIFPRFDWTLLAPFVLVPILIACQLERSWLRRAINGAAGGFVFWFGVCYWIQFVLEVHGGMGRWGGWGTFVLFAFLKGLHMALFAALAGFVMPRPWAIPAIAALWAGIERTHGPFGFAWLDLGNAAIDMPVPMRLAPLLGVYGMSFVFALLNAGVALLLLQRPRKQLAWLLCLVPLPFLPAMPSPTPGTIEARVVQPNVDTEAEWTTQSFTALERTMALLSRGPRPDVLVWPEMPAPFYPADSNFRDFIEKTVQEVGAPLIFGGLWRTPQGAPLNSAFVTDPQGRIVNRYDKIKLVPFGEFVPPPFGFVNRITKEAGDFEPGTHVVIFNTGTHRVGTFICYESAFPDLVRQFTREGAEVLMNLSNDGYFGTTAAREQHLLLVRMRAAENSRWILRATNDGYTVMVDPAGRITDRMPPYRDMAATMKYNFLRGQNPYVRFGDWFAWSCLIAGLVSVAFAVKPV